MRKSSVALVERAYRDYMVRGQQVYLIFERAITSWIFSSKVELQGQIYALSELGLTLHEEDTLKRVAIEYQAMLNAS